MNPRSVWQKKIPTFFGILILIIGVGATSILVRNGVILTGQASPTETPRDVRISNISDSSFTVSYITDADVPGSVAWGITKDFGKVNIDLRDQQKGSPTPYKTHYITIRDLEPKKTYYFSILSGVGTYLHDTVPFEVITADKIPTNPPQQNPIIGKIIQSNGAAASDAIVYVKTANSQTLSTLTKTDGNFVLPITGIRDQTLATYQTLTPDTKMDILVTSGNEQSNVSAFLSDTNPLPIISLSNDYDFSSETNTKGSPNASSSGKLQFPIQTSTEVVVKNPSIESPKKDQEFTDQQPQFRGTAIPGQQVNIIIRSDTPIETKVTTSNNGVWTYRPTQKLAPGEHTIEITTLDASGILKTITQSFTVYAQGNQVNQSATPSATITQVATPTPTKIPSATPTLVIQPTTPPMLITTPTPIVSKGQPQAPGNSLTLSLILGSIVTIGFGILMFFIGKKHAV